MGFLRDFGAAATVGLTATTKQKDAEASFEQNRQKYEIRTNRFNQAAISACSRFEEMELAWNEAKAAVIESGALTVDPQGNLAWGWFRPTDLPTDPSVSVDPVKAGFGAVPGMFVGVGAPVATWTLVGLYGTAGTGVAISSLSGAAFTTASAAWLGRLGISGAVGLGMRGAPAVLGGIGLVVGLPVQVLVGAKVAGNRERKAVTQINANSRVMGLRDIFMNEEQPGLEDLGSRARAQNLQLLHGTAQMQATLNLHGQDATQTRDTVNNLLQLLVQARELCAEMKRTMEAIENWFRDNPFPPFS